MKKPKVSLPKSSNPPLKYFFLKIALRGFFCLIGWVCMFVLHVCVVCLFVCCCGGFWWIFWEVGMGVCLLMPVFEMEINCQM